MKTFYSFLVAVVALAFLNGCGSSPSSSKDETEKAVRDYVGMTRDGIGEVHVDNFKILNESQQKAGNDDVFLRKFEAIYTVTYNNNRSKHSFAGTIAMLKQGQKWSMRKDLSTLTYVDSPPIVDGATLEKRITEEDKRKIREESAQPQGKQ